MASVSAPAPQVESALQESYEALREIASYALDPTIAEQMRDLGERKDLLDEAGHKQLMALVDLTQRLTIEKLRAELAMKRIEALCPDLVRHFVESRAARASTGIMAKLKGIKIEAPADFAANLDKPTRWAAAPDHLSA